MFVVYEWNMDLVCAIVWWVFDFVGNRHAWFFVKNQKQNMGGCSYFKNLKRTGGFFRIEPVAVITHVVIWFFTNFW